MSDAEKIAKFDYIQKVLWDNARQGDVGRSTIAAALIRAWGVPGPDGESPEEA